MSVLDTSRGAGLPSVAGARNTFNKRFDCSRLGGLRVSTAVTAGSTREYKTLPLAGGGIPGGRLVAVFLAPGPVVAHGHVGRRSLSSTTRSRKALNKKGRLAVSPTRWGRVAAPQDRCTLRTSGEVA